MIDFEDEDTPVDIDYTEEKKTTKKSGKKAKGKNNKKHTFSFTSLFKKGEESLPRPVFYVLLGIIYAIVIFLIYYFGLPVLHIRSTDGWFFVFAILLPPVFLLSYELGRKKIIKVGGKNFQPQYFLVSIFTVAYILITIIGELSGARIFTSKSYANLLTVTSANKRDFDTTFDYDDGEVQLPVIDKDIAYRLAQTKLGNYGDQYEIKDTYFSIQSVEKVNEYGHHTYSLVRVTPLEYANLFVSLGDMNKGTPGYIKVDCTTQESEFVAVEGGIKYLDSGKFSKDLSRYIRFNCPTAMTDEKYFEIDDEGNPYWIVPCHSVNVGLYGGYSPTSVIVLNAVTGRIDNYAIGNEPKWVDHVVSLNVMQDQANDYLKYKKGFINATIGSKSEVFSLSDGYNYFIKDNNSYFVSTVTSPNENDQTSIGFLTINLKNKETKFYNIEELQGLTEMRAREIAMQEDSVKAQNFDATWPILISYKGEPTYFLTLKNAVSVQKYCFIDVKTGIKVAVEDTLEKAKTAYINVAGLEVNNLTSVNAVIRRINIVDGKAYFNLVDVLDYTVFEADLSLNKDLYLAKPGDKIYFQYDVVDGECVAINVDRIDFAED